MKAQIDHVVVLMLENRSFDSMLGGLYQSGPGFDGLTGQEANIVNGAPVRVWAGSGSGKTAMSVPTPDPHEKFVAMTAQIFGTSPQPPTPPTMGGFAQNYATVKRATARDIMHYYTPEQVPAISTLARAFGVSDRWHASAPNQTWPNRFFAHTGTAGGFVNNTPLHLYDMETIYNQLTAANCSWRIYYHDIPQSITLSKIWGQLPDHLYHYQAHFAADAAAGRLPNYSFIEPRYFSSLLGQAMPNDEHPPHDVTFGEQLIAETYNAIRSGPGWERTLLIITYDEHGGLYDHVAPPAAVPPGPPYHDGFTFDRYGVRVPAVLVSPWIPPGVVRPADESGPPFDHSSILATLGALFDLGTPLTPRVAAAPHLLGALTLDTPSNGGPASLPLPGPEPAEAELLAAHSAPPNDLQESLALFAEHLPSGPADAQKQAEILAATAPLPTQPRPETVAEALARAETGLDRFLNGPGAAL